MSAQIEYNGTACPKSLASGLHGHESMKLSILPILSLTLLLTACQNPSSDSQPAPPATAKTESTEKLSEISENLDRVKIALNEYKSCLEQSKDQQSCAETARKVNEIRLITE